MGRALPKGEYVPVPFICEVHVGAPRALSGTRAEMLGELRVALENLRAGGEPRSKPESRAGERAVYSPPGTREYPPVMSTPLLVSSEWLAQHLGDRDVRIVDVRWSLLDQEKGRSSYAEGHLPGAVFLDVETDLAAPRGSGPGRHPLPAPERFAATMSNAGIGPGTHVVVYDFGDGSTAARLWWLLRYFGHPRVSLLDGGIARWAAEDRPLESRAPAHPRAVFTPAPRADMVATADQVEAWRHDAGTLIVDSRTAERYEGKVEPIDPVAAHVPGARNRPYGSNMRSKDDPRFLDPDALREAFRRLGADRAERVVCYCGSGINACQNLFALSLAGFHHGVLYAGSWSDWCSVPSRATRTGPEP
jgi:thiosulfate/3-mercaptopyruvate sulfurtransferase